MNLTRPIPGVLSLSHPKGCGTVGQSPAAIVRDSVRDSAGQRATAAAVAAAVGEPLDTGALAKARDWPRRPARYFQPSSRSGSGSRHQQNRH